MLSREASVGTKLASMGATSLATSLRAVGSACLVRGELGSQLLIVHQIRAETRVDGSEVRRVRMRCQQSTVQPIRSGDRIPHGLNVASETLCHCIVVELNATSVARYGVHKLQLVVEGCVVRSDGTVQSLPVLHQRNEVHVSFSTQVLRLVRRGTSLALHHITEQPLDPQAYLALLLEPTATREHLELAFNTGLFLFGTLQCCRGEVHIGGEHLQKPSVLNLDGGNINWVITEPGASTSRVTAT